MVDSPKTIGPDPNKDYASIGRSILLERAASGTPRELPKATPWPAPRGWANQNVPLPPPVTPAEQSINDMMKLPPDWDYQNPSYKGVPGLGPNGEKLPEDALGWTPFATPYYGPGLEGWWRGTVSRLNAPISYEAETIVPIAEPGEELPWYQKALGTLENLGARFYNAGGEEGGGISPGVYVTRGVSEMVKSILDLVQVPSLGTERLFGTARTVEERYAEEFDLPEPEYKPFWEGWNAFQEFSSLTSPVGWSFKLGQMLGAKKLNTDESYDLLKEGWNTGRVFYSTIVDPAVAQEYKRRYNDAEDPVLLGMELENPMAEMVGQIVMDPLNLLGFGARKLKDARKLTSAREDWFTLPKVIDDVLKAVGDVDEIAAVEKVQELAGAVRQAFVKLKDDYRISALTADGKRYIVSRKANELTQWTIFTNSGGDSEKAMDIIRGWILLSSDDADEVATGISIVKNASTVSPSPYLSNAGLEGSATLRNLIGVDDAGKLDPEKFIDELIRAEQRGVKIGTEIVDGKEVDVIKKGLEGVTHHVSQRVDETINKMFPTITERIKAGEKLPYALKQLGRFDRFAQKSVYKPVNTFFAGIYMGLSPGYAMRNLATNTLHVLVDQGPGALRYKPANLVKKGQAYLGGAMADIGGFGKGVLGVETYEAITRKLPFSRLSEKFEQWGAIQTVSRSIEDSMLKMMKPGRALPDIMPLVDKGMDRDNAELLVRLVIDNKGEVKKAVSEFKEMVSKGNIDAFKTSFWLNDGQRTALHGFEIYDDFMDAISGATTRQEAMDSLNKVFDDVLTDSARVSDEVPRMSEMAEGVEVVDALVDAGVAIPDATIGHATSLFEANSQAMYYMDRLINDILSSAFSKSDPETAKLLQTLRNKYARIFNGSEVAVAKGQQSKFTNEAAGWKKKFQLAEKNTPLATLQKWWKDIGIPGEPPSDLTLNQVWSAMWEEWYFPTSRKHWRDVRDVQYAASETILKEIGDIVPFDDVMTKSLDEPRRLQRVAVKWDEFLEDDAVVFRVNRAIKRNDKAQVARIYAEQFLISDTDQALVDIINANITEGRYATLADVPPDVSFNAFVRHATGEAPEAVAKVAGEAAPAAGIPTMITNKMRQELLDAGIPAEDIAKMTPSEALENLEVLGVRKFAPAPKPVQPYAGGTPSMARVVEQSTDGLRNLQDELLRGIDENWGRVKPQEWSDELEKAVNAWEKGAVKGVGEARLISVDVANAARDFTMLSYPQKKYFDLALAYIYPYHFWYNRTYSNWLKRVATSPEVIAGFAKYQDVLGKIHAGAPEWWKYNINSNEVLGIDNDNPLFFNLMSTLNPMQGLTGVDFTDSKKRINWWTAALDDLNKFGPSTWTPYSIATAAVLYHQGETEAASRWGGRLFPQTAALKSATALLNIGPPGGLELDPAVGFFSGGMDPYERRQVGRALYGLQEEGLVDPASAMDAAYFQEGDAWDTARDVRTRSRSLGQIASFMFGTGFKARSAQDMEIDRFDAEYFNLWAMEDNMKPEEFQQAMDEMRKDYPFMDAVLLSRKGGLARDRGFAYNVLSRIPPGQKGDISDAAGLDKDYITKFYEDKGHIEDWVETDRQRFMAFVVDVGAILDMPDEATKDEWKMVVGSYSQMTDRMKEQFGEDIQKGIDRFWVIRRDDDEASYAYLEANPIVEQAMTWKDATQINDPLMGKYYVSIQTIERYYNGVMYDAIDYKFGKDIWDIEDGYFEARLLGKKQANQYLEEFPQLKEKWDLTDKYEKETAERIVGVEEMLRSDVHPFLRAGAEARSIAQENIMEALQTAGQSPYELGWQDFRQDMSPHLQSLVEDYVLYDDDLSSAAYDQIEYIARDYDITTDAMLQLIERDMVGTPVEQPQTSVLPERQIPEPTGERQPERYREPGPPMQYRIDDRLSDKAKDILARNMNVVWSGQVPGIAKQVSWQGEQVPGAAFAFHYPESIARREEGGFKRFGAAYPSGINEETYLHELAHTIDFVERVSSSPEFAKDAERYEREEEPDWEWKTNNMEWFAMLFARAVTGNQKVPGYMMKWFKPYIK